MGNYYISDTLLSNIAGAVRTVAETQEQMTPKEMSKQLLLWKTSILTDILEHKLTQQEITDLISQLKYVPAGILADIFVLDENQSPVLITYSIPEGVQTIKPYAFSEVYMKDIVFPSTVKSILYNAFYNYCIGGSGSTKVYIPQTVTTVSGGSSASGAFMNSGVTDIYTDATSKPSRWGTYWNKTSSTSNTYATVHYGVSRAEYEAL